MREEDAIKIIVSRLRDGQPGDLRHFGYDLHLDNFIRIHIRRQPRESRQEPFAEDRQLRELYPVFANAAWELCRRGILRPGVKEWGGQSTGEGEGFSLTPFGRNWISEGGSDVFVPTEPERFAEMLAQFKDQLGAGFHGRGQEAIKCYNARAYLACCVMCGAASESIFLAIAIAKIKDEKVVLREYSGANGRRRIENRIIGQAPEPLRKEFSGLTVLLKYWRDEAAHGKASNISDNEAYTSLGMLLRFALFAKSNWEILIS